MSAERGRRESQPSYLITEEENKQLFSLIGPKCQSLATAVAQVLSADPPSRSKWTNNHIGVLCFIKDHVKRSYFFRVFCLERQSAVWEQELYVGFEYRAPRPYFHTFEGHNCRMGLSFADIDEASSFLTAVKEHLRYRAEKLANRRRSQQTAESATLPRRIEKPATPQTNHYQPAKKKIEEPDRLAEASNSKKSKFYTLGKRGKDKPKKLTKSDIGQPTNFEHISHAGLGPNHEFSLVNLDPNLLNFFASAGVSEEHLNNRETRKFIFDFLDQHGGKEAAIREVSGAQPRASPKKHQAPATPQQAIKVAPPSIKPPPLPVSGSPASGSTSQRNVSKTSGSSIPPPPPMMNVAPPAPPMNSVPPAPPMKSSIPPAPPMKNNAPPPPPLPVPGSLPAVPPEPPALPVPSSLPAQPDPRSDLMSAIRDGQKLKPVAETERSRSPSFSSDPKSDLLEQIRAGKELKHVERSESPVAKELTPDGIAGALARALQDRSRVIHSDSESDQEQQDDDYWDDWEE